MRRPILVLACSAAIAVVGVLPRAEAGRRFVSPKPYNPEHQTVELFQGIQQGVLNVRVVAKDSTQAIVLVENKTEKPLNVKLPPAFVAVMKQFGPPGGGGGADPFGGGDAGGGGGSNQSFGGGFGGMGGMGGFGGMGMGGMGGMFNVPAQKVGKLPVRCVCLEHGKKEPRPAIQYKLIPVEQYSSDPRLKHLLSMVHPKSPFPQKVAQAAAWHIANRMSWQQLAAKQVRRLGGLRYPYFTPQQLRAAMLMVRLAEKKAAEERKRPVRSPGEALSQK